uniref:HD domain protein n=1 Tax=Marseillevirus LCMAC103 TaxID=2506604 RepID=A0A481YW57_9VIRU|nr:MAG: HD domain protein [Marseillevirus LCMAC103]
MAKPKTIADPIHGRVTLSALCVQVIDTPEFQRLRDIKQLGMCAKVFPGATHTRFEHSVGVAHLAKKLITALLQKHPAYAAKLPRNIVQLIELAGLCHDLGHGPFSHMFDEIARDLYPAPCPRAADRRRHEHRSTLLLKHIVEKYDLALSGADVGIVCDFIDPPERDEDRLLPHRFLYSIVSNPSTGIDVDKFDYIKRDSHYTRYTSGVQLDRLIYSMRIIDGEVCFPLKTAFEIYDLFWTRYRLHHEVYQHRVVHAINLMIGDCLRGATKKLRIFDAIFDIGRFGRLSDAVLALVRADATLVDSNNLLDCVDTRDLYCLVSEAPYVDGQPVPADEDERRHIPAITRVVNMGYGADPVANVWFFRDDDPETKFHLANGDVSFLRPATFDDKKIRTFFRG